MAIDPIILDFRANLDGINADLNKLDKNIKGVGSTGEKAQRSVKKLRVDRRQTDESVRNLKKVETGIKGPERAAKKAGEAFSRMGQRLVAAFAISTIVRNATKVITDYQDSNARLNATLSLTREQTAGLRKEQIALGGSTAFTAAQVADAQLELGKLGQTIDQITATTPAVLDLAAATGVDLATAAKITAETLNQFSLDASESGRVADVMAKSFSTSALDIGKFSIAMASAGPVAQSAGVSLERTTALIGTLADRGLDASTAGTSLRNMFLQLSKEGLTFEEAMQKVRNATDQNAEALRLFGTRGATTAVILANNAAAADDLETKLLGAAGSLREMAETQMDTISGDIIKLNSAYEAFILSLEDGEGTIGNFVRQMTQGATAILQNLSAMEELAAVSGESLLVRIFEAPERLLRGTNNTLLRLKNSVEIWGNSAEEAIAKGNWRGAADDIEFLQEKLASLKEGSSAYNVVQAELERVTKLYNDALRDQIGLGNEIVKNLDEQDVKQKGIIEMLKERLALIKQEITGATSQTEINRLLTAREDLETRINAILNQRQNILDDGVDPELEMPTFPDDPFGDGSFLDPEREAAVDDFYENLRQQIQDAADYEMSVEQAKTQFYNQQMLDRFQAAQGFFGALSQLMAASANESKEIATALAIIEGFAAVVVALNTPNLDPVTRAIYVATISAQVATQIARIKKQEIPSFYEGTDFVSDSPSKGRKRDDVPARLHYGEAVITSEANKRNKGLSAALNKGSESKWIYAHHVLPAILAQKKDFEKQKQQDFATSITQSMALNMPDQRIVNEVKRSRLVQQAILEAYKSTGKRNPFRA